MSNNFTCKDQALGLHFDPAVGVKKECQIAKGYKALPKWVMCGNDGGTCRLPKNESIYLVRYGTAENERAQYTRFIGKSFKCLPGQVTGYVSGRIIKSKNPNVSNFGNVCMGDCYTYKTEAGPVLDPAPGKPKSCAYAGVDGVYP